MRSRTTLICVVMLAGTGCDKVGELTGSTSSAAAICHSPETAEQLKSIIFDAVQRQGFLADQIRMNDLRRESRLKIEMPLLKSYDDKVKKTECSGRLVLEIPVGARAGFGETSIRADTDYTAQPSADGKGIVYELDGFQSIAYKISNANLLNWHSSNDVAVPPPPAQLANTDSREEENSVSIEPNSDTDQEETKPSFDCNALQTQVEQMICSSPELSRKDAALGQRYRQLVQQENDSGMVASMVAVQRRWLKERDSCDTEGCLVDVYNRRLAELGTR